MENILEIAAYNQQKAWEVINDTDVIGCWESVGAKINLVGSLKSGLLMKHRDIDFHVYTDKPDIDRSFAAVSKLAQHPSVQRVEYRNLIDTVEKCIEWHAWCFDDDNELWQIDMIHILKGSLYDGYFEKVTRRIMEVLTTETRQAILELKYATPDTEKIMGIEYYQAVIRDGIRNYADFAEWRKQHPVSGVVEWMP